MTESHIMIYSKQWGEMACRSTALCMSTSGIGSFCRTHFSSNVLCMLLPNDEFNVRSRATHISMIAPSEKPPSKNQDGDWPRGPTTQAAQWLSFALRDRLSVAISSQPSPFMHKHAFRLESKICVECKQSTVLDCIKKKQSCARAGFCNDPHNSDPNFSRPGVAGANGDRVCQ